MLVIFVYAQYPGFWQKPRINPRPSVSYSTSKIWETKWMEFYTLSASLYSHQSQWGVKAWSHQKTPLKQFDMALLKKWRWRQRWSAQFVKWMKQKGKTPRVKMIMCWKMEPEITNQPENERKTNSIVFASERGLWHLIDSEVPDTLRPPYLRLCLAVQS